MITSLPSQFIVFIDTILENRFPINLREATHYLSAEFSHDGSEGNTFSFSHSSQIHQHCLTPDLIMLTCGALPSTFSSHRLTTVKACARQASPGVFRPSADEPATSCTDKEHVSAPGYDGEYPRKQKIGWRYACQSASVCLLPSSLPSSVWPRCCSPSIRGGFATK